MAESFKIGDLEISKRKFVQAIYEHPAIWQKSHPQHAKASVLRSWDMIGAQFGIVSDQNYITKLKAQLQSLQTYSWTILNRKSGSGYDPEKDPSKWFLFDSMLFLLENYDKRPQMSNATPMPTPPGSIQPAMLPPGVFPPLQHYHQDSQSLASFIDSIPSFQTSSTFSDIVYHDFSASSFPCNITSISNQSYERSANSPFPESFSGSSSSAALSPSASKTEEGLGFRLPPKKKIKKKLNMTLEKEIISALDSLKEPGVSSNTQCMMDQIKSLDFMLKSFTPLKLLKFQQHINNFFY